ncbi:LOW QUALITY PROTEIN: hypothetical protein ACHAXR_003696, partial [Thalassiosira sp. AJA248-18]
MQRQQSTAIDAWQYYEDDEESQLSPFVNRPGILGPPPPPRVIEVQRDSRPDYQHGLECTETNSWESEDDEESQLSSVVSHQLQPDAVSRELTSVTAIDILSAGLTYVGFDPDRQAMNNIDRRIGWFKAFFGVEPTTVAPFFVDLRSKYPDIRFKDCLMTMNWVYLYDTYIILSARWKYCEEYIGSKLTEYGQKMAKVARKKILFEERHFKYGRTVDCSTFMVNEMRLDPSSKWFDYKTHSCGL